MKAQISTQKGQHIADFTDEQARVFLEGVLWPAGAVCHHCKSKNAGKLEGETCREGLRKCRDCQKQFTVTMGTIFEDSHLPLRVWLRAFHMMCSSKKGISALQLQRNLGLGSYRTAWHMAHRIRHAMETGTFGPKLTGTVEVDETYVGGKVRGKGHQAGRDNKTPVVSLVERREGGRKYSLVMPHVTAKNLKEAIRTNVAPNTVINTDEATMYAGVKKEFKHETVDHHSYQYVRRFRDGHTITTNTVESSFALLKRGIVGAFHHVSAKHLHRYCSEFDFRWNHRTVKDTERTAEALIQSKGKCLRYKRLKKAA